MLIVWSAYAPLFGEPSLPGLPLLSRRRWRMTMTSNALTEAAKAVVRRNTEEVQGAGDFELFEALFDDNFIDHTPQPNMTPDKSGVRGLYQRLREAFPDFRAVIHWQTDDGEMVTTFKA